MSKKMLKRSLALGALMAFVITGQAWAAANFSSQTITTAEAVDGSSFVRYTKEGDVAQTISGNRSYSYTVNVGTHGDNVSAATSVLGQSYKTSGNDLTFDGNLTIYQKTNSGRNMTGAGTAKGIDIYSGTFTVNGETVVDVHSVKNANGTAINVTGITAWGYDYLTNEDNNPNTGINGKEKLVYSNTAKLVFNDDVTVNVSSEADNLGYKVWDNKTYNNEVPGSVTGVSINEDASFELDDDATLTVTANSKATSGRGATTTAFEVTAGEADVKGKAVLKAVSKAGEAYGININSSGYTATSGHFANTAQVDFSGDTTIKVEGGSRAVGVYVENKTTDKNVAASLTGENVNITATGDELARGVVAKSASIDLGAANSNVKITLDGGFQDLGNGDANPSVGVWAWKNNSTINVNAATLTINGTVRDDGAMYGIIAQNTTQHRDSTKNSYDETLTDNAKIVVSENTETRINIVDAAGKVAGDGVLAMSDGTVDIRGDLYVTAKNALFARGDGILKVNAAGNEKKIVQLNGDIYFGYADNSGTVVDADVDVKLTNADSYLKGNIIADTEPVNKVGTVTGMKLTMTNGATWELDEASVVNEATFGAETNLVLKGDGNQFTGDSDYALNGVATADVLKVEQDAKLKIEGIKEKVTYNIAKGFESIVDEKDIAINDGEYWTIDNNLLTGEWKVVENVEPGVDGLQVTTVAKEAGEIAKDMGVDGGTADALAGIIDAVNDTTSTPTEAQKNVQAFANAIANVSPEVAAAAAEAVVKMAEAGGNNATAASIVKNVTGVTNDRLSFNCGHSAPHKGGHGVGLFEEGSGADIWVEYVHGKDEVEDMKSSAGATSYEGSYDGIVMGVDFKKVNKFQSGIAFNYGEGDTNSVDTLARTRSDYDFWGIGYYGNIHNDDSNVIFDINYAKSDSDVTNYNVGGLTYEASPETTTWTAGVKVEKLYQNNNVQIVPYTGLRYMSIDADDYATKCGTFNYKMDRQDIWLLPLGVSIRQEIANDNGWTVSPRVDLSYIWAFGDTDSDMEFATAYNNKVTNIGYDVMDDGSFLGLVGIEAHKGQWGYGIAYSYQKGDHSESKKWFVDVNYSF